MTERSTRFALPFILPGQAQKEAFHNEAVAAIDGHTVVMVTTRCEAGVTPAMACLVINASTG